MCLQIEINNKIVHEITSVDFDVKEYHTKLFDFLESINVNFFDATKIVEELENQIKVNIQTVIDSGKVGKLIMVFDEEYEKELSNKSNNTESKGE
jgi:hypothetical protein